MKLTKEQLKEMLTLEQFPLSAKYDPQWVLENEMGPSALWLMEWLSEAMDLKPGMRVLDMGCGTAMSSIFLAREFGVQVWANDLWISPTENWERIRAAGMENQVFPLQAEAHSLPYAEEFFDAAVSIDAYQYFGTGDLYLDYFRKFVRPDGQIGIVVPGLVQDFDEVPEHLTRENLYLLEEVGIRGKETPVEVDVDRSFESDFLARMKQRLDFNGRPVVLICPLGGWPTSGWTS